MLKYTHWKRSRYRFQDDKYTHRRQVTTVTIKDIARNTGVSVSSVSRVLNHHPDVSDDVRQRVLDEVERSGYVPNNIARDLVRNHSDTIGVIVRGNENLFFSSVLKVIGSEIADHGYTMVLHYIDSDDDEVKAGAILERERKLLGLIFLGGRFDYSPEDVAGINIPYVLCTYNNCFGSLEDGDFSSVTVDDHAIAYTATRELTRRGHRRIAAVIPSRNDHSISELRYEGYLAALRDHGIEADPALVVQTGGFEMEDGYRGMEELLHSGVPFTAAFVEADMMAIAAVKALHTAGKKVPDDCSVIAIDGLKLSEYMSPTLTTMIQPGEEIGRESVHILVNMIADPAYYRHLRPEAVLRKGHSVKSL